ncbi:ABC transporter ATP-binding protein [Athalassotoga saccharophila]|uniref:ABC transporter ATP-binding protein n=1 Tax=Athalassotoga saccharophila TaxID=1441386 RepID=UPI00137A0FC5|nr:ABC transporter ATP-binding protein [Athalassotoga saccharophila]BBJ28509.1 putative 2-aminoethylphosphonate import ATP-binding protein PhnT [Athalassotoga saccharophila]
MYLEIKELEARVGTFKLGPVSFSIEKGDVLAILGPSGSGKSTLLRAICGLIPSTGSVILNGVDMSHFQPHLRRMAMMFQEYALFPHMNTFKNISFPLTVKKVKKDEIDGKVKKRAREIDGGLEESLSFMPKNLPEGLKQATAFARETVREFDILMLDEPFSRLDAYQKQFVRADLKKNLLNLGKTYILVVSDVLDALAISNRMMIMIDGKVVQDDLSMNVYQHPKTLDVAILTSPLGLNVVRDLFGAPSGKILAFRPDAIFESESGTEFEIISIDPINAKYSLFHLKNGNVEIMAYLKNNSKKVGERLRVDLNHDKSWTY